MGCFSVYCGISNITITYEQKCALLPLKRIGKYTPKSGTGDFIPATLPIWGEYNDYGELMNIIEDDNTKLIETYFGCTISDFCGYLSYYNTYNEPDDEVFRNMFKFNHDELKSYKSMWIIDEMYDFLSPNKQKSNVPLTFDNFLDWDKIIPGITFDLRWILPMNKIRDFYFDSNFKNITPKPKFKGTLQHEYLNNIDLFYTKFLDLKIIAEKIMCMSKAFEPHNYNIYTPQCGDFEGHQAIINKISEINKSIIQE